MGTIRDLRVKNQREYAWHLKNSRKTNTDEVNEQGEEEEMKSQVYLTG